MGFGPWEAVRFVLCGKGSSQVLAAPSGAPALGRPMAAEGSPGAGASSERSPFLVTPKTPGPAMSERDTLRAEDVK